MKSTNIVLETDKWNKIASKETVENVMLKLKDNGINVFFVETKEEAKNKVLEIIPKGSEIFALTSKTLDDTGITKEINESGNYDSVRNKLNSMNRETQKKDMRKIGSTPDFAIGSVHAVTEDGNVMIASGTGSQLPADVYGAGKVIWVVGTQKIVKDLDAGFKRIYEHSLVLESERLKKLYGLPGSFVSKILIVNKEFQPDRITLIFVNEVLGF